MDGATVVADAGSPIAPASIVAREYGIPAVVGKVAITADCSQTRGRSPEFEEVWFPRRLWTSLRFDWIASTRISTVPEVE